MHDLDRYIIELARVRRVIQVYIELFTSGKSVDVLTDFSKEVFGVIQKSMHDEIVISLARLFDSKKYNETKEHLSQFNLVSNYENVLTEELESIRQETKDLLESVNIKQYRHAKVAHNDKSTLLGKTESIKHNITSEEVVSLIEKSFELVVGIKSVVCKSSSVSIPVDWNEKYEGQGTKFINKLKEI